MIADYYFGLQKEAFFPGFGAIRAAGMTDKEKEILAQKYGLSAGKDANFKLRNEGRSLAGSVIGGSTGKLLAYLGSRSKNGVGAFTTVALPAVLGATGSLIGSSKYTSGNAQKILDEQEKAATKFSR